MKRDGIEKIRRRSGFDKQLAIEPVGLSGGTCLFWQEELAIEIDNCSRNNIAIPYKGAGTNGPWNITFVYGNLIYEDR